MLNFDVEQKVIHIGNIKIGDQPEENPSVMIGTVLYAKHVVLLDEIYHSIFKILYRLKIFKFY